MIFGVILIVVGIVWYMQGMGWVDSTIWSVLMPLFFIIVGLKIFIHRSNGECWCSCCHSKKDACCSTKPIEKVKEVEKVAVKKVEMKPIVEKKVVAKVVAKKIKKTVKKAKK